jgi:hypothetical protein
VPDPTPSTPVADEQTPAAPAAATADDSTTAPAAPAADPAPAEAAAPVADPEPQPAPAEPVKVAEARPAPPPPAPVCHIETHHNQVCNDVNVSVDNYVDQESKQTVTASEDVEGNLGEYPAQVCASARNRARRSLESDECSDGDLSGVHAECDVNTDCEISGGQNVPGYTFLKATCTAEARGTCTRTKQVNQPRTETQTQCHDEPQDVRVCE